MVENVNLIRWPDGLSASRGYLWVTASALHEVMGEPKEFRAPFHILRIPLMLAEQEKKPQKKSEL
jgi:hypothetical protein